REISSIPINVGHSEIRVAVSRTRELRDWASKRIGIAMTTDDSMSDLVGTKIVIAGGSGFLGLSLSEFLGRAGAEVVIVSRSKPPTQCHATQVSWDGITLGPWVNALDGADAVINLSGRTVDCIKTPDHRDEILRSRVESTSALGLAMREVSNPPPVWVQMSTAHLYGDPPSEVCTESSATGLGLAPDVARAWEAAFEAGKLPTQRGVIMRTSFVIGRDRGAGSGALGTLGLIAKLGLGGRVGQGTQGMSWIHETDLNRLFAQAIFDERMSGAYIVSSPNPVPQVEFMRTLRRAIGMPIGLPAFEWMVRLGAPIVFRTDPELALYGRYVVSERVAEVGFEFNFPQLEAALNDLYRK
ncbi:MAG: epimerase, partial [Rubripirellula sp.]